MYTYPRLHGRQIGIIMFVTHEIPMSYTPFMAVPAPTLTIEANQDIPISGDQFQAICIATFDYTPSFDAVRIAWTTSDLVEIGSLPPRFTVSQVQRFNDTTFYREALFDPVLTLDSGFYGCLAYAREESFSTNNASLIVYLNVTGEKKMTTRVHIILEINVHHIAVISQVPVAMERLVLWMDHLTPVEE